MNKWLLQKNIQIFKTFRVVTEQKLNAHADTSSQEVKIVPPSMFTV